MSISVVKYPDFPAYAVEYIRLCSFEDFWPKTQKPRPNQLSDAGFFYSQIGDRVICFCCGGGLRDWEENDNPWEQHALWFGKCEYVILIKGQKFVDQVKHNHNTISNNKIEYLQLEDDVENLISMRLENIEKKEEEENHTYNIMDGKNNCKICCDRECDIACIPCGHVAACSRCISNIRFCPICRNHLDEVLKIYFS